MRTRRTGRLLPNTFLQALVCRALTGPILPEDRRMKVYQGHSARRACDGTGEPVGALARKFCHRAVQRGTGTAPAGKRCPDSPASWTAWQTAAAHGAGHLPVPEHDAGRRRLHERGRIPADRAGISAAEAMYRVGNRVMAKAACGHGGQRLPDAAAQCGYSWMPPVGRG